MLLLYITSWYWAWMEYRLAFSLANVNDPKERLNRAIQVLTEEVKEDRTFQYINEIKLNRIVTAESSKAYFTKQVDQENKEGVFAGYKALVAQVSNIILEINPDFPYSHMLASTMIEGSHHQRFFAEHLPSLTDVEEGKDLIPDFYKKLVFKTIEI